MRGSGEEVFNRVKSQRNNSQFLRMINLMSENGVDIRVDSVDLEMDISRPYYPENVLNIHLNKLGGLQKMEIIALGFENLAKHGVQKVEFRLLDSGLVTSRPLVSLGQFYGDLIAIDSKPESGKSSYEYHYNVVMEQNKFLEEDIPKNCVDYPTEEFEDYQSCDDAFQRKYIETHYPSYKPYWAFGQLGNEVPNAHNLRHNRLHLLVYGATKSTCPLPCITSVAKTRFMFEKISHGYDMETLNWILFNLPDNVRLTETLFRDYSIGQILSDIGGTLGLWLGLGVLQLFHGFASFKYNVAAKTSSWITDNV